GGMRRSAGGRAGGGGGRGAGDGPRAGARHGVLSGAAAIRAAATVLRVRRSVRAGAVAGCEGRGTPTRAEAGDADIPAGAPGGAGAAMVGIGVRVYTCTRAQHGAGPTGRDAHPAGTRLAWGAP